MRWVAWASGVALAACAAGSASDNGQIQLPPRADGGDDGSPLSEAGLVDTIVSPSSCAMGTRAIGVVAAQTLELITAYGAYWNFAMDGTPDAANGALLESLPRFASGPCAGRPAGMCDFDTRTFATYSGEEWESITAYGKYWNFVGDSSTPDVNNGSTLDSVDRYATGPCLGQAPGTCVFDTRVVATLGGQQIDSITAYGKYWNFVGPTSTPDATNGSDLTSVPRYATGPCAGRAPGACVFDTRAFETVAGASVEQITAYGKYWNYTGDASTPDPNNGADLRTVSRYASGPCKQ